MSELKDKHIALVLDENGSCISLAKVKVVSKQDYNKLENEYSEHKAKEYAKELQNNDFAFNVANRLEKLEKKDFLLAKSIYDNFVDRGLLNDNDKFQKDFYDFIFNSCELLVEDTPTDFQAILRKVGNL